MVPQQDTSNIPESEAYALSISCIISELIKAYNNKTTLNFTKCKSLASRKYKLPGIPKTGDIIAALPTNYRPKLLPFLKAKPVRTASGASVVAVM